MGYLAPFVERFICNKYASLYMRIIDQALNRNCSEHNKELHHILPKSLFPEYKNLKAFEWNSVYLTFKEHYICHRLLPKFCKSSDKYKMAYALLRMTTNNRNGVRPAAILYERSRKSLDFTGKPVSDEARLKMSMARKGIKKTDQHKKNMSKTAYSRPPISDETRSKMKISNSGKNKGMIRLEETKQRIRESKTGVKRKPFTREHSIKLSESRRGLRLFEITEPDGTVINVDLLMEYCRNKFDKYESACTCLQQRGKYMGYSCTRVN